MLTLAVVSSRELLSLITCHLPMDSQSLYELFHKLVNQSFDDLQSCDSPLRTYVVDLLVRFARSDALYQIRDPGGQQIDSVVGLLIEAERVDDDSAMTYRTLRHTGDYALFMSGIFRSYVERNGYLDWYMTEGPRSYRRALLHAPDEGGRNVLERLWRDFEQVSGALDYMRKVYFGRATVSVGLNDLVRRFELWN